ncbi:MAG: flagellar hook-basal body complex protein FliE [Phycisphaeraceae bacterium]|nr:flagellar hook-basal body complex protein FliE [Phycisphaeraceae bacterium]
MSDPLGLIGSAGTTGIRPAIAPRTGGAGGADAADGASFKDVLMKNIEQVNKLQQDAEKAIEDLATGQRNDLDGVLIAKQKADMAFQLLVQVRNKMVDAFEEIKQMRV